MDKIKFTHLKRLLTCQPYFIWHNIEDLNISKNENDDDQFEFQMPSAIDTLDLSLEISAVQARTFKKVERSFFDFIKQTGRVKWIDIRLSIEDKLIETKKLMRDNGVDIIFNPVFEYEDALSSPTFYDKRTQKISNLKISSSTKRIDLIKPYFDYQVITKSGIEIKEISYFILDTKKYNAFEIAFFETFKINTSSTSRQSKDLKEIGDLIGIRKLKSGNGIKKNGSPYEPNSLFDIVSRALPINNRGKIFQFDSLKYYLRKIKEAKTAKFEGRPTKEDLSMFGNNPNIKALIENSYPEMAGFNGKLISNKEIIEGKSLQEISREVYIIGEIMKNKVIISDEKALKEIINKIEQKRVIWYDFEGFSLPFPTIKNYLPFQQATFQTSIIETKNMKETNVLNHIFDPKTFNYNDFPDLITQIYSNGADSYVVFNKGYENPRLKEMVQVLQEVQHPKWKECDSMVQHIIENTVDLEVPFATRSKNSLPQLLIPQLKGKSSIKLIEKYITKKNFPFAKMITPYSELDIQNGQMAMESAINRVINIIKDKEWENKQIKLKKYCENDVRAMIMVYSLIKYLLK
ncbi:MAG: DUF2779 domain-containing protein [Mycoplasma sp.]|nr:DUF2779 domain-containing protein [Mycoplasma sp.]